MILSNEFDVATVRSMRIRLGVKFADSQPHHTTPNSINDDIS